MTLSSARSSDSKIALASSRTVWITGALLFVSVVINYIDRGNLSIAAPLIKNELGLSPQKLGDLLSAFFWTYAPLQLVAGWLLDRYERENWILAIGFFLWSIATFFTGLTSGFAGLFAMRLVLGVAESIAFPTYSKILAIHFTENQRGLVNAFIEIGTKCGIAIGTLVGGFFIARFGWRPFFIILGLGALPWLFFWIKGMPRQAAFARVKTTGKPSALEILSKRSAWVTFIGTFSCSYFWFFLLTWLPFYLVRERHFSMQKMAVLGALPFIFTAIATTLAGWWSYRAIAAGVSPTRVRKTCTSLGLGLSSIIAAVPFIADARAAIGLLILSSFASGIFTSSHWAITQTIAGPRAVGRWAGMQNFISSLAGVVAPIVTGLVVQRTDHFFWAFVVTGAMTLAGSMLFLFGLDRVEPIVWRDQDIFLPEAV